MFLSQKRDFRTARRAAPRNHREKQTPPICRQVTPRTDIQAPGVEPVGRIDRLGIALARIAGERDDAALSPLRLLRLGGQHRASYIDASARRQHSRNQVPLMIQPTQLPGYSLLCGCLIKPTVLNDPARFRHAKRILKRVAIQNDQIGDFSGPDRAQIFLQT